MAIVIDSRLVSAEFVYALEFGGEALGRQTEPRGPHVDLGEQLKLFRAPEGRKQKLAAVYQRQWRERQ
jgi:hypothetical protein